MADLALTYRNQGRWEEAEELNVQVVEMSKQALGEDHPNTLTSMANLVLTYLNQGRWKEAEELNVQVVDTRKRALGEDHPDTLTSMANLALTLNGPGESERSLKVIRSCATLPLHTTGDEHPDSNSPLEWAAIWEEVYCVRTLPDPDLGGDNHDKDDKNGGFVPGAHEEPESPISTSVSDLTVVLQD
ncbi:hypothetical protein LTR17_019198 [Elasticomyces elasticus]|nr:hypothetical protein LTR17_019198 [Elasticomyces elasticus]